MNHLSRNDLNSLNSLYLHSHPNSTFRFKENYNTLSHAEKAIKKINDMLHLKSDESVLKLDKSSSINIIVVDKTKFLSALSDAEKTEFKHHQLEKHGAGENATHSSRSPKSSKHEQDDRDSQKNIELDPETYTTTSKDKFDQHKVPLSTQEFVRRYKHYSPEYKSYKKNKDLDGLTNFLLNEYMKYLKTDQFLPVKTNIKDAIFHELQKKGKWT